MPPSQWDGNADRDLLLTIIDEGSVKGIVWPKVAVTLQGKGYTFTHEACRQHFQKIRKKANLASANAANATSSPSGSTPADTPKKKAPATPRKKAPIAESFYPLDSTNDDDDEDLPPPPSSKRKRITKKEEIGTAEGERGAYQFKIEQLGGTKDAVDLEHDDLYDDVA